MELLDLNSLRSVDELVAYRDTLSARLAEIDREAGGLPLSDESRAEWDQIAGDTGQLEDVNARIEELEARSSYLQTIARDENRQERAGTDLGRAGRPRATSRLPENVFELAAYRQTARSEDDYQGLLVDGARRAIELADFSHPEANVDAVRAQVTKRVMAVEDPGAFARRILATGSPTYDRAFGKTLKGIALTGEEMGALSLTGTAGGFAVPFDLDPTIIPTSNGVVNPIREIAEIKQTTVDTWRGVSSGAVTASYAAEATETTDNSPTLAQPEISTEKAQAFIPFTIEVGMDWPGLRGEMARLLQDGKDTLEATKFLAGTGTNEPFGVLVGTTNTVNAAAGADAFTVANLYELMQALPPRYRPRARFVGNLTILNRVRQFQTSTDMASILVDSLQEGVPSRLLGKPLHEASEMPTAATTGLKFLLYGDFSRYVIVDRVGLTVELIPHLMGTNHRPTGERGLYAFWRNGAKVVDANAFRALLGTA